MKILYYGYIYSGQNVGGINRYFENIIKHLPGNLFPILSTRKNRAHNFPSNKNLKIIRFNNRLIKNRKLSNHLENYYMSFKYKRIKPDIFHPTYYNMLIHENNLKYVRCPIVLTVYDLIHELFIPESNFINTKKSMINRADKIICISENTKKDLINFYNVDEEKVKVIYLASDLKIQNQSTDKIKPENAYFLYVGTRAKYKNMNLLYTAFQRINSKYKNIKLFMVGKELDESEKKELNSMAILEHIKVETNIDDEKLSRLYNGSIALVFPTRYEGFGYPALEAMICGTVPLASNVASIPEILGDAGILFDNTSVDELTEKMFYLFENPEYRDLLIKKGFEQAKLFNWENTVKETTNLYQSLV